MANGLQRGVDWEDRANTMVEEIALGVAQTASALGKASIDSTVLEALRQVPRHMFVTKPRRRYANANDALCIGEGQSISQQPFRGGVEASICSCDSERHEYEQRPR